ncbi:MAG: glutamate formiminotransferase / 5-formyltetrahydrofolate cyclo-ligase [Chloroflexota bacterium]|jgi:glutamate formiminotransferase|nr:glutamate formiminotransferase / 5-formyltetrahydrofolate cyclo-ligase [Chloroflexota bacterium]
MAGLIECVPNFSEGRRPDVIDAICGRVRATDGVHLLDRTSDSDHNRSVLTFAGPAEEVTTAMEGAVEEAIARIDMNGHAGQHPRIGAVDVIPFVPLAGTTMDEAIELARDFGERIAERFELPVFMYAKAALRSDRETLADIRRPQYEGLRDLIGEPGNTPDFGPARLHPTAGAVAVGARPFLIAYNINLETRDLEIAKDIARRVRERSGGLPRVQALGLDLAELRCVQVSMNLLDFAVTPMWRAWETVTSMAADEGVAARESELIGLVPLAALVDVADHADVGADLTVEQRITHAAAWLKARDFEPTMALELRLAAAQAGQAA